MEDEAVRWMIHGRVQGVSFRWFARREATELGVRGWVRNRGDGTVEVEARGPREKVEALRERLSSGPRWARVDRVEEESIAPASVEAAGFEIRT